MINPFRYLAITLFEFGSTHATRRLNGVRADELEGTKVTSPELHFLFILDGDEDNLLGRVGHPGFFEVGLQLINRGGRKGIEGLIDGAGRFWKFVLW